MSDVSDRYRSALEDVQRELLDTGDGDWLPGTSRAHGILNTVLAEQNPNGIEVEIRPWGDKGSYEVRCHGGNGIATLGPLPSLADALRSLADWATSQAEWRETADV